LTAPTHAEDLGRGIGLIHLPLSFPGLRSTNAFTIEAGSGLTLVDCGVDDDQTRRALDHGLEQLGYAPAEVATVVATHMHPDHMGLAHRLVAAGLSFVMHEAAATVLDRYNDWNINNRHVATLAVEHGAPEQFVTRLATAQPRPDWAGKAVMPTRLVGDGDRIPIGGSRYLEVVYTPGHDAAHICLIDSETGILFSGDHVLPRITPVVGYGLGVTDPLGVYLESLRRIEDMDIAMTYPAHGDMLDRGSLRARQIILHHERRLGAMTHAVRTDAKSAWELVGEIFRPHLDPFQEQMAFSETLAHLEYLRLRDELVRQQQSGVWYYARPPRRR
jgi:glyoxylase-like metal-dependent hydrolase (beta-lactamase superfamily II)